MLAAKEGHTDVCEFLLDQGAHLDLKDGGGVYTFQKSFLWLFCLFFSVIELLLIFLIFTIGFITLNNI